MTECPHCQQPLTSVYVYTSVAQRQEIEIIDDELYLRSEVTYELPRPPAYKFRCRQCGGDLARYRHRLAVVLKK